MTPHNTNTKHSLYFLSLLVVTTLVSCSTTQTLVGSDDGIYADESETPKTRIIVQDTNKDYKNYNENYFSKELERLEVLNGTDILTDIENYQSEDYEIEDEGINKESDVQINYNSENAPWGYDTDTDIVINVNTFPNNRIGWNFNTYWGDPFWDGPIGWNRWGWGWNNWGYNPWWAPYYGPRWGWNNGLYCPPYGLGFRNGFSRNHWGYYNNRYNRRYINSRNGLAYNRNINRRAISRRNNAYRSNRTTRTYNTRRNTSIRNSNGTRTIRGIRTGGVKSRRINNSNIRTRKNYSNNRGSSRSSSYSNSRSSRSSSRSFSSGSSRSSRSFSSSRSSSRGRGSSRRR
ncbi:hypothetical protein BTO06_02365 [Tenacibaculum sp. SZ-18]|uniref:hypothetical protein n=1 Tax=Tenacibaculum sp. SZ-18 TaxID=754423 RepID=UPI000C2D155E|nr:hypothetical protein [Tenacibaculum sp. SZ-18]AUC14073.1 hypothetical protein BTO06_02365 [Tenacibaculum sp. SZ-18]